MGEEGPLGPAQNFWPHQQQYGNTASGGMLIRCYGCATVRCSAGCGFLIYGAPEVPWRQCYYRSAKTLDTGLGEAIKQAAQSLFTRRLNAGGTAK